MPPPPKRRRRLRRIALAFATVYTLLMLFGGCANKFILFPSQQPIDPRTAQRLLIPADHNRTIEVWTDRSPGCANSEPAAYVLEFTGNATRAEQVATYAALRWQHRPVEVWTMNYPGYGASTGPADLAAIPPAALRAYDELAKKAANKPILLAGNSLGTTAALYVATQRPTAGLILQNPPAIRSLILREYGWWNLWLLAGPVALQVPKHLDSPTNAAKVNDKAVFVLADDDTFVIPENQKKVLNAYAGEKRVIRTIGGHNERITGTAADQLQSAFDWLWEAVPR